MMFRIMTTNPGVLLDGQGKLKEAPSTDKAIAMAMLAWKIGDRVHRRTLANLLLPVSEHVSVGELLAQKHNVSRISTAASWLREVLPDGEARVPKRLVFGGESYYQLLGSQDEVDAWVMMTCRAHAEEAIKAGKYPTALAAARDGLALWEGPLHHKFFEKTEEGRNLRALLDGCHSDLFGLFADAVIGRGGDLTDSIRFLEQALNEEEESSVALSLIRVLRAAGREADAERLAAPILKSGSDELKQSVAKLFVDETTVEEPTDDSLMRSMVPSIQIRVAQIDTANHSQRTLMALLEKTTIHPDFRLFVISGVSAAGKDSLVATAIKDELKLAQSPVMMTKYTTRPGRPNEAGYSQSLSEEEFVDKVEAGGMAFLYEKRKKLYGFDLPQLQRAMTDGTKLIAIFTEFGQVPEVRRIFGKHGAVVVPILINVDLKTAIRRTHLRPFTIDEKNERVQSIIEDMQRMTGRAISEEYVVIEHSNDHAFDTALTQLVGVLNGTDESASTFLRNHP